jgi:hypothetical protein
MIIVLRPSLESACRQGVNFQLPLTQLLALVRQKSELLPGACPTV